MWRGAHGTLPLPCTIGRTKRTDGYVSPAELGPAEAEETIFTDLGLSVKKAGVGIVQSATPSPMPPGLRVRARLSESDGEVESVARVAVRAELRGGGGLGTFAVQRRGMACTLTGMDST